jgi:hypothetical protein
MPNVRKIQKDLLTLLKMPLNSKRSQKHLISFNMEDITIDTDELKYNNIDFFIGKPFLIILSNDFFKNPKIKFKA